MLVLCEADMKRVPVFEPPSEKVTVTELELGTSGRV